MITFKTKEDVLPSTLILLSIAILIGALVFLVLPKPSAAGIAKGRERSRQQIREEIERAKEREKQARAAALTRLWTGDAETVTASVLAQVTQRANESALQMGAFRPQRVQPLEGLTELPFSVQVSGPYPAVRKFLTSFDSANSRLALRSVQIAAADGKSSAVTATLGISAFRLNEEAAPAAAAARPAAAAAGSAGGAGSTGSTSSGGTATGVSRG